MIRARRIAISLSVASLLIGACSGDDDEARPSEYCRVAAEQAGPRLIFDADRLSAFSPEDMRAAFGEARAELEEVADAAPDEIAEEIEVTQTVIEAYFALFEEADFDFATIQADRAQELTTLLAEAEFTAAVATIAEYDQAACGSSAAGAAAETTDGSASGAQDDPVDSPVAVPSTVTAADGTAALAADLAASLSQEEQATAILYAGVSTLDELAAAILAGDLDQVELDAAIVAAREGIPFTLGDDPELDILWRACEAGDEAACDGLYLGAPPSSRYRSFAASCGGRATGPAEGTCNGAGEPSNEDDS